MLKKLAIGSSKAEVLQGHEAMVYAQVQAASKTFLSSFWLCLTAQIYPIQKYAPQDKKSTASRQLVSQKLISN